MSRSLEPNDFTVACGVLFDGALFEEINSLGVTAILPGESKRINTLSRGWCISDLPIVDERNP